MKWRAYESCHRKKQGRQRTVKVTTAAKSIDDDPQGTHMGEINNKERGQSMKARIHYCASFHDGLFFLFVYLIFFFFQLLYNQISGTHEQGKDRAGEEKRDRPSRADARDRLKARPSTACPHQSR